MTVMPSSNSSQQSSSFQPSRVVDRRLLAAVTELPPPNIVSKCHCGVKLQMKISTTERNPFRRFGRCPFGRCDRFAWLDVEEEPNYAKAIINVLIRKYDELARHEVDSSNISRQRVCNDCRIIRLRCQDLEAELDKKELQIVERRKLIQDKNFLAGIVVGFILSFFLVLILK